MMTETGTKVCLQKETPQTFVDRLLNEGANTSCDESNHSFNSSYELPAFYDEVLFTKGQQFFHKYMYAMFFCAFNGLLAILAVPSILKILVMTKMSSNNMQAYRRYVATLMHMMVWYDRDFKPGSDSWKSITAVRKLHNSASLRGTKSGVSSISQKDMALTQFGFMGFALARTRKVGVHGATDEEWTSFVHFWRVVGHLFGIEDRFNICKGTLEETREICNLLIRQVFRPLVEEKNKEFLEMTRYLVNGLWCFNPVLQFESAMTLNHGLITIDDDNTDIKPVFFKLTGYAKFKFWVLVWAMDMMKYNWFRIYHNFLMVLSLFLITWFPFLAYYQFGIKYSHVRLNLKNH